MKRERSKEKERGEKVRERERERERENEGGKETERERRKVGKREVRIAYSEMLCCTNVMLFLRKFVPYVHLSIFVHDEAAILLVQVQQKSLKVGSTQKECSARNTNITITSTLHAHELNLCTFNERTNTTPHTRTYMDKVYVWRHTPVNDSECFVSSYSAQCKDCSISGSQVRKLIRTTCQRKRRGERNSREGGRKEK